jgi:hypothetical protein
MKVQLGVKEYISNLVSPVFEPMLVHFFDQLFAPNGGGGDGPMWRRGKGSRPMWKRHGGGEPTWQRATGRGGADHHAD